MIKFDRSQTSVVVRCTECPYWWAFALDQLEAYRSGERHEVLVHDEEPRRAAEPRLSYERRHAGKS